MVVDWPSMAHFNYPGASMTFSVLLSETTNEIDIVYGTMNGTAGARGSEALSGAQNADGSRWAVYRCHVPGYLTTGLAIRFTPN